MTAPEGAGDPGPDAETLARWVEEGLSLAGDAARLYPWGGFAGPPDRLASLPPHPGTEIVAELFPPYRIRRPPPVASTGGDPAFRDGLASALAAADAAHASGPATLLCVSRDIRLAGGVLYDVADGRPRILHETYRPCDRPIVAGLDPGFASVDAWVPDDGPSLLLDSAGSFNYGHFLIDDLPRLAAVDRMRRDGGRAPVTILLMSYNVLIDAARRRAIGLVLGDERGFRIRFLDRTTRYRFARLHHVTPVSEHPILKSPDALRFLARRIRARTRGLRWRDRVGRLADALPRPSTGPSAPAPAGPSVLRAAWRVPRLFVDRPAVRGRDLVNREAVLALVAARGFRVFDPETTHVGLQAMRFSEAGLVVGIMGAAMANTVFCAPGTPLLYLTPEGWDDSFYWDLAAVRGHRYATLFGPRLPSPERPHLRPFRIDVDELDAALRGMGVGGP